MSKEEKQETLYTLPQSYVEELLVDIQKHLDIGLSYIESCLTDNDHLKPHLALFVEYLNYNFGMRKVLIKETNDPHMFFNEQTGKEEYVITQGSLLALQALVLGKHAVKKDLNSFGISMMLN
jgi:hypothetical protein